MNRDEYLAFKSEIKELEALLAEIPERNLLERMSLEARLKAARSAIEGIAEPPEGYKAILTFKGRPVSGCHGIAADFGTKAAGLFAEVVTAVAVGLTDNLQDTGPIPDKQKNQLLITGVAIGSFGFEYELPLPETQDLFQQSGNVEKAITLVQNLFKYSVDGSDDDIAEIVQEIHRRAIKKTAEFLNYVAQNDAWCTVDFKDKTFSFRDLGQINKSSKRLQENNIRERAENYKGEFQGILPASRTFEFKCDDNTIIKGKIGHGIGDPDQLNREYLHKPIEVGIQVTRVGEGKPKYALLSIDNIKVL